MALCRICDVSLTDENWQPGRRRSGNYICRQCQNKQRKNKRRWNRPEKHNMLIEMLCLHWNKYDIGRCTDCQEIDVMRHGHLINHHEYYICANDDINMDDLVILCQSCHKTRHVKARSIGKCTTSPEELQTLSKISCSIRQRGKRRKYRQSTIRSKSLFSFAPVKNTCVTQSISINLNTQHIGVRNTHYINRGRIQHPKDNKK